MFTRSAFCFGDTRQARTTSTRSEVWRNVLFRLSLASIMLRDAPPMMIAFLVGLAVSALVVETHSSS